MKYPSTASEIKGLLLSGAATPEDLFDEVSAKKQKIAYLKLVHPDVYEDPTAHTLATKISELFDRVELRVKNGVFGDRRAFDNPITIANKGKQIELTSQFSETSAFVLFTLASGDLFFLTKNTNENKNAESYNKALESMWRVCPKDPLLMLLPKLELLGNYQGRKMFTFALNRKKYIPLRRLIGKKIPVDYLAWVINRIWIWVYGINTASQHLHTSITPDSVLVDVDQHDCLFVGFESAVSKKTSKVPKPKSVSKYNAPELQQAGALTESTDIYSAAVITQELLEPNWEERERKVLQPILNSILGLSSAFRVNDPLVLCDTFRKAWRTLYGPPKFKNFNDLNITL